MTGKTPEVADVFRRYGKTYVALHGASMSTVQRHAMRAIELCRTAALGGHVERCDGCGHQRVAYNSCRNRNCPKCQSLARAQWLADRQAELLDVPYFHVVFTVPDEVAVIAFQNKPIVYDILFRAASETLRRIAADPPSACCRLAEQAGSMAWPTPTLSPSDRSDSAACCDRSGHGSRQSTSARSSDSGLPLWNHNRLPALNMIVDRHLNWLK
jgi:hypothetical protein